MPATSPKPPVTTPDNTLVIGRPRMAKVTTVDNRIAGSLSPLVKDAAKGAHGKQELAAAVLGQDGGNFSRDADAERLTLRHLRLLGPDFLARFGRELTKEYDPLATPKARAKQLIRDARRVTDELDQLLEHIAS